MPTIAEERDRARSLATSIVSLAIMAVGLAFVIMAFILPARGGLGLVFIAILLGGFGLAVMAGGFFFHLVPSRLETLEDEKRDFDRREREEEDAKRRRLQGNN